MGKSGLVTMSGRDLGRRLVTVFGAVFQVVIGAFVPVGSIAGDGASLVIPVDWAFAIWGPIFLFGAIYAVYQALPSKRYDPLLRRIGWPLGLAFVGNGVWIAALPIQSQVLSYIILASILISALVALTRFSRYPGASGSDRWIIGLSAGLLAGWLTVANVVSLNDLLVGAGVIGDEYGAALVGAGLLLAGAVIASSVVRVIMGGQMQAVVAYTVAVMWGLFGVVANQYDASLITSGVALVCLVALAVLLFGAVRKTLRAKSESGGARVV